MNYKTIFSALTSAARELLPNIVPGAAPLIKAGESLVAAFQSVKEANGGQAPADAEKIHEALVNKVSAHAKSTADRLDG